MTGQTITLSSIHSSDTIKTIKSKIHERTKIPIIRQHLLYNSKLLNDNYNLSNYDIKKNSTLHLTLKMNEPPPSNLSFDYKLNQYIYDISQSSDNSIIVFMLANALSYDRKLKERYIQNNYQHDTFRQQLPIPILLKAYNQKNNIKFFFIDNAFRDSISKIDIRLYLQKISSTNIQIDKNNNIEIYNVLLEDIFNYFNISYIKENIDLYASFHFIPYTYGYCQDTKTIDVNYCLDQLDNLLERINKEYYIYESTLDNPVIRIKKGKDVLLFNELKEWHNEGILQSNSESKTESDSLQTKKLKIKFLESIQSKDPSSKKGGNKKSKKKRTKKKAKRRIKKKSNKKKTKNKNNRKRNKNGGSKGEKLYPVVDADDLSRIRALIPNINTNQVVYAQPVANAPPPYLLSQDTHEDEMLQRQATVPLLLDQMYPLQNMQDEDFWDKLELEGCIKRCIYN